MELNNKQLRRLNDGREYRAMTMRALGDSDAMIVEGYATTFNQPYLLYDGRDYRVMEQVAPTAFAQCDMTDVIMQYDHEGRVFARNRNNTLALSVDTTGLKVTADLGGTDIGRQVYQEIKGGYTDKMSFGFVVAEDHRTSTMDYNTGVETVLRTITKIKKLYDVSAVSIPANDMTSISARRYADGVIDGIKAERLERDNKRKKLILMLEV
ncbi:HK97 family phage prohead protease [Subdoligranulum variabile]|uniref:Phage prohead protease, HK97 family n=1 Tax=Subdoligranulum variabile DSM 15176 TaxID=411471 RepID=D1PND0_9FIRM|nr:HK97 family phage prohead protease [Subdoligranulum variabile]EFB76065.1 phage prohead protease, HK97 family [Subdoligranulum variabile DSM 15176]UWP68714.1 HK97 family phage prohead protease [Subdoligranulum variabile]